MIVRDKTTDENVEQDLEKSVDRKPKRNRYLVLVTGGKGGTGKSTFARGFLDVLRAHDIDVSAFDGDPSNSQLYRYYKGDGSGVSRIELGNRGEDILLDDIEQKTADVILVDIAAGGNQTLANLEKSVRLLSNATEMGYQVVIVSVLSRIKDSVNLLRATMGMTAGHDVRHVAVKNLYFGEADRFRLFDDSQTKERLLEDDGIVLNMPELSDDTYEALDQKNIPFRTAIQQESGLSLADRSRVFQWLQEFEDELRKSRGWLL